jgi:hypothetical protein
MCHVGVRVVVVFLIMSATARADDAAKLAGPFATIQDWCKAESIEAADCDTDAKAIGRGPRRATGIAKPWSDARVIAVSDGTTVGWIHCAIAVRTAAGWFAGKLESSCATHGELGGTPHETTDIRSFAARDVVRGESRELILTLRHEQFERGDRPDRGAPWIHARTYETRVVVCGMQGETPACTDDLVIGRREETLTERGKSSTVKVDRTWTARVAYRNNAVHITGGPKDAPVDGVHHLGFGKSARDACLRRCELDRAGARHCADEDGNMVDCPCNCP